MSSITSLFYSLCIILNLGASYASFINLTDTNLIVFPSDLDTSADTIECMENQLTHFSDYQLSYLSHLQKLVASYNSIEDISSTAFLGTILSNVDLDHNQLSRVPDLRAINNTLTLINLKYNRMRIIRLNDFRDMGLLQRILIGGNQIHSLQKVWTLLPSINFLGLVSMNIPCCRSMRPLRDLSQDMLNIKEFPCTYPDHLKSISWWNITAEEMEVSCGNFF